MRYVIKRETTGKVGRSEYDHRITILHHFQNFDEALTVLKTKREIFRNSGFNAKTLGPDSDYYVILCSKELDCIDRYWIEPERAEPELPWWLL